MVARCRAVSRGIQCSYSTTAGITTTPGFQDDLHDLPPPGGHGDIEADLEGDGDGDGDGGWVLCKFFHR